MFSSLIPRANLFRRPSKTCQAAEFSTTGLCDGFPAVLSSFPPSMLPSLLEVPSVHTYVNLLADTASLKALLSAPSMYALVQRAYWDTGYPFSYWTLSNIPHFLIASPTVYFVLRHCSCMFTAAVWKGGVWSTLKGLWEKEVRLDEERSEGNESVVVLMMEIYHILDEFVLHYGDRKQ